MRSGRAERLRSTTRSRSPFARPSGTLLFARTLVHVERGQGDRGSAFLAKPARCRGPRDAEPRGDLDVARVRHHHVLRTDVAVDDVENLPVCVLPGVRVFEPLADPVGDVDSHGHGKGKTTRGIRTPHGMQVLSINVFEGDEVDTFDLAVLPDGRDGHVVELSCDLRFVNQHGNDFAIPGKLGTNPLDCDEPGGGGLFCDLVGLEYLGHSALTDSLQQQIGAQAGSHSGRSQRLPEPFEPLLHVPEGVGNRQEVLVG